jgi:hypothetical protein
MPWHFRGAPHYVTGQARRLGLSADLLTRSRPNKELCDIGSMLAQLCDRYHRAPIHGGAPIFGGQELKQIRDALNQAEIQVDKLHAVAGAAQAMLTEAWTTFGLEAPARSFRVACDFDEITAPLLAVDTRCRAISPLACDPCQSTAAGACSNILNPSRPYATMTLGEG